MQGSDETDRFSTGWVLNLEKEYRRTRGRAPLQPGHWDPDPSQFVLPPMDLHALMAAVKQNLHRYHYAEDLHTPKQDIAAILRADHANGLPFTVTPEHVSIQSTSTQALFQLVLALRQHGAKRVLVCTPVYFSIWEACLLVGCDVEFFDTAINDGATEQVHALVDHISASRPHVVVVSAPHYPTGIPWRKGALGEFHAACASIGATLVVDATHSGLDWGAPCTLGRESIDNVANFAIVQSPAKAYFVNGARFAHVVASAPLVRRMEDNVHVTSGAISMLQAEVAATIYAARRKELEGGGAGAFAAVAAANLARLASNHEVLRGQLQGTGARVCASQSGIFTMVEFPLLEARWPLEQALVRRLLFEQDVLVFTGSCYRVAPNLNPLCARLTLSSPTSELLEGSRRLCGVAADLATSSG